MPGARRLFRAHDEEGRARGGGEPGDPALLLHRQAGDPGRRARDSHHRSRSPGRSGAVARGAGPAGPAPGAGRRVSAAGGRGARLLDRVRRVLGRDDARPPTSRDQRRALRADAAAHRRRRCPGRPGGDLSPRGRPAGRRGDPRARRRRLAPAHVRPDRVPRRGGDAVLRRGRDALSRAGGSMNADVVAQAKARAREYFTTKGTRLPVSMVHERIAEAFGALDAFLEPIPAAAAARAPIPGEWSIQEVVDHLVETHRPGLDELWCLLAGHRPPGDAIPVGLQSKAPLLRPWPWLREELARVHGEILRTLAAAPPDFVTDARAPIVDRKSTR